MGKELLRRRGEKLERPFAHQFETGGVRRLRVRGLKEVRKKLLVQATACNLALLLRTKYGAGTPQGLAEATQRLDVAIWGLLRPLVGHLSDALLTNDGPDPQKLNFPPGPLSSSAEESSTGGGT